MVQGYFIMHGNQMAHHCDSHDIVYHDIHSYHEYEECDIEYIGDTHHYI